MWLLAALRDWRHSGQRFVIRSGGAAAPGSRHDERAHRQRAGFAAGPFVSLTVTGHNSGSVRDSMPIVIKFAEKRLQQLQEAGSVRTPAKG